MKPEVKVQLFVGILTAVATIVAAVAAAMITASNTAETTAVEVATEKATSTAEQVAKEEIEKSAPSIKLFPPVYTRSPQTQRLGEWQACVLVAAGESHFNQACTCFIEPNPQDENEWQLRVNLDPSVDGQCNCRAACFNGLVDENA